MRFFGFPLFSLRQNQVEVKGERLLRRIRNIESTYLYD